MFLSIKPKPSNRMAEDQVMKVSFIIGPPGAGKGTMSERLVRDFGLVHLSAGDLLRAERASGSTEGELINSFIAQGNLVPVEITIKLLYNAMVNSGAKSFLVDGFPRNQDNIDGWNQVIGDKAVVLHCILLECPEDELMNRLLGRSDGRDDDQEDIIRKRFRVYHESTLPIVSQYEQSGLLRRVNAMGTVNEVYDRVRVLYE